MILEGVTQFGSRSLTEFILSEVEGFEMTEYLPCHFELGEKSFSNFDDVTF